MKENSRDNLANPRVKILNKSGSEIISFDHNGTITGINLIIDQNITASSGSGLFQFLGSQNNKITTGWFTNLFVNNINTTEINSTIFRKNGNILNSTNELNTLYAGIEWDYNQTSAISLGYYINYTPITTTGNITNGTLKGYSAANNICNVYYSGSHMCQAGEILNSINRNQSNVNFTATFWISEGAPGYLSESYDCSGLTTSLGTSLGSIWVGSTTHLNTFGIGSLVACSAQRSIGCCG